MADEVILDNIPFQINLPSLMRRLHIKDSSQHAQELQRLAQEAQAVARPKAVYKAAYVEARGDDHVVIDSKILKSRVLRVNLEGVQCVFPYIATCGIELDGWPSGVDDLLLLFWADLIKEMALEAAEQALEEHLEENYALELTATMNPGSLEDWPLSEQRPLFDLLGNPQASIGVRLTESFLMVPLKSLSGIRFPSEESFESCRLCRRENCPGRRAAYDKGLYERKYGLEV